MIRSKGDESFCFTHHGTYDVSDITDHLLTFNSEWLLDTSRQETYTDHEHTFSYFLTEHSNQWGLGEPYALENKCVDLKLLGLVQPLVSRLEELHSGKVGKALFIKLPAGKVIAPHYDGGEYLHVVRRNHIPIITNESVSFTIDGESRHMSVGEIWEVNNNKLHSVANNGSTERVHLLIDIIPSWAFVA
jgi:hypothetical protein